jgi:hypothetical protein
MRRVLPAWLTAMPWTLRSGDDVCQWPHKCARRHKPPPSNTEADVTRHKFTVGKLMDFAHPDRA